VPSSVWADIALDFVEGFPRVGGKTVVLTVVDRFSKYAHFIALSHPCTAISVARVFFDNIVRLHGVPCSIVSDRDLVFTSAFWSELFSLAGVTLRLSTAFHPQTDGQSEVANRILGVYLRCLAGDRPTSWLRWLPWAEYCYNTSYQLALQTTPFRVVYGRDPPALIPHQAGSARVQALDRQLMGRDAFLEEIRERLLHSQDAMKRQYDAGHRFVEFQVGDWVWLRLHQRLANAITDKAAGKLAPRYCGPYKIQERVGKLAYRLELPPRARIHCVFHVVFLKKFEGEPPAEVVPLPVIRHGRVVPIPSQVIKARLNRGTWEVLVRWEARSAADATWEPLEQFTETHPAFQLEDELFAGEGGSVMDAFYGRQYRRCGKPAPSQG
jgi:hypothetical protein